MVTQLDGLTHAGHDVFISYASGDKGVADGMCEALEAKAIRCWIAPRDVPPGVPYGEAIIDALAAARILILILSARSNNSPHVMKEVERVVSKEIPILPFRIEEVKLSKNLEYFLAATQWLDALPPPPENHFQSLAKHTQLLLSRLKGEPRPEPPVPPPIPTPRTASAARMWAIGAFVLAVTVGGLFALLRHEGATGTGPPSEGKTIAISGPVSGTGGPPPRPVPVIDVDKVVRDVRASIKRRNLSGAAQSVTAALALAPDESALKSLGQEVLNEAAADAVSAKQMAERSNGYYVPE